MVPESISQLAFFFPDEAFKSIYNKIYNKRIIYKFDFAFLSTKVLLMTTMIILCCVNKLKTWFNMYAALFIPLAV